MIPTLTLAEARENWQKIIKGDGGHCPCCDRWGKWYQRGINYTMAAGTVWLAVMSADGEWIEVPKRGPRWMVVSNQFPTMRWWGLVERNVPMPGEDKKFTGFWRATELGKQWAAGKVKVPKYVWTYNNTVMEFEEPMVLVSECLENFSYKEVMDVSYEPRKPKKE